MSGSFYRESRNVELSTLEYLTTQINASWSGVTIVKSFTNAYKGSLPVVCIALSNVLNNRREVGSTTLLNHYTISIDIFGKSWGQTTDLADFIVDKLKDNWTYYVYSQDSAHDTTLAKASDGQVVLERFTNNHKIEFGEDVDNYDKFRWVIECEVRKSE